MMKRCSLRHLVGILCVGLTGLYPVVSHAQSEELLGAWTIQYARNTRAEADGTLTVLAWGEAELEFQRDAQGELVVTWSTSSATNSSRAIFRGSGAAEGFSLLLDWGASGGAPTERVRSQHLTGRVEDGRLVGETWILGTAARSGVRMPWNGRRVTGDPSSRGSA